MPDRHLGTDKRNPSFTICRDTTDGCLHVYYGGEMFEKVPEDRNDPQYKMMVARLYNAGVNAVKLKEAFGVDRETMQCWGDALNSGDVERLVRVLAGQEARRKLNPEIRAFVRMRFPCIYRENPSAYSPQMRAEIKAVYGKNGHEVKAKDVQVQWMEGSSTGLVLLGSADADQWYELALLLKEGPVSFGYLWLVLPEVEDGTVPKVSEITVEPVCK